ncbi:MAG: hypothetical protein M1840_003152 [Geoglossum simile]|nr:MAG: hypothetical protein M1840_003152 [Geoglossum simile]
MATLQRSPAPTPDARFGLDSGLFSAGLNELVSLITQTGGTGMTGHGAPVTCRNKRGNGLFNYSASSTWQSVGVYELGLDPQLGFGGAANYGYDKISFLDQISIPDQIVGVINTTEYWLGFMGLGSRPTNFTSEDKPSLLASLVTARKIPSLSYGFTAGAFYRLKSVPASLTLGGYDSRRFIPHNISFLLDPEQQPLASVNKISVSSSPSSGGGPGWDNYDLMSAAETALMTIDSSTPYLWLPESVCLKFEKALGIVYDDRMQVYVYPNGSSSLQDWNLTFTFTLADLPQTVQTKQVNITLPFDAFNFQLSYPSPLLVNATNQSPMVNYFPLRKAANSTQYTLGRAFLQEAYLKLDYERNNFSIYQAVFTPDALTNINIVSIPPNITQSSGGNDKPLGTGAIAGIAVGGAILLIGAGIGFYLWRRSSSEKVPTGAGGGERKPRRSWFAGFVFRKRSHERDETTVELEADHSQPAEFPEGVLRTELDANSYPPVELQGDEVYSGAGGKSGGSGGGGGGVSVSAYEESNRKLYRSELHEDTARRSTKRDDGTAVIGGVQEHYYPAARYPVSPPLGGYHPVPQSPYSPATISDDGQIHRSNSRNSRFREEMVPNSDGGGGSGHQEQKQGRLSPAYGWTPGR